ncbi:unnamed protein product, partial [Brassica rapa]
VFLTSLFCFAGFSSHHMVLNFHSFKGRFINFRYVFLCKIYRRISGSLLTESSPMSPFHNRSERFGFSDLGLIYMFFRSGWEFSRRLQRSLPDDFQEVFQTTLKKSSRRLPRSLL